MKKRRKAGIWLLVILLVLTQISFPGAKVQVNAGSAAVESVENSEEKKEKSSETQTTTEKATEETGKAADSAVTSEASKATTKEEETTKAAEETTKAAEETTKEPEETTKETEGTTKAAEATTKATEATTKADAKKEEAKKIEETAQAKSEVLKTGEETGEDTPDESEEPTEKEEPYQLEIKAVDENDNAVSGAKITLQTSTDPTNTASWTTKTKDSSGLYSLPVKEEDKDCYYKFNITATNYYEFQSETFSLTQESNPYFSLSSVENKKITISAKMKKKPDQYRVTVKAVDENGKAIENATVNMQWSVDIYSSYTQEAVSAGVYDLNVKKGNDLLFYKFDVLAAGYTPYEGTKFCFDSRYWNPYFSAATVEQAFTITVSMTSKETALERAKISAVTELANYKNPKDYRQAEQEEIKTLVETWTEKINKAATVNSVTWNLNYAKGKLDKLKTNLEYENEEYRSRIYFQTTDGQKTYADEYGVVTITNIDSGNFYITHPDGSLYTNDGWNAKWRCVNEYRDLDHPESIAFDVIVGTYGQFAGKFVGRYDATVALSDLGREIHFTVRVLSGRVDKLRAFVDGKDVSGGTIKVKGSEKKRAVVQGRLKGTNRWISVPAHALKYTPGGSTSMNNVSAEFRTWGTSGSITYTLDADRSVSTTIKIQATIVMPTAVKVVCPAKATVGDWNGALNQYVGIMEGTGAGYYHVVVTPENASNPGVTWEELTPDVATFQTLHAAGIVPKKAGTAKFKVSCVANPKISTTVKILFQYERPLKTAKAEKSVYYAKPSDKTINLNIITNGQKDSAKGASEQRFTWSYSTSGVAKVTDSVHYDKSSVTIPNWFSHTISILGEGVVYVTGTPYDQTENCKPVTFKVVVTSDVDKDKAAAQRVEGIILSIGTVTLEKKSLIQYARSEFQALTPAQKGLVDDDIYAILVAAELELRRLERGDTEEEEEPGGDGGTGTGGNGQENESGGTENSNPSGGEEAPSDGTDGEGTNAGESGVGNESSPAGNNPQDAESAAQRNAIARRRTNSQVTVQADTNSNNKNNADSAKKAGAKGKGRIFHEIDIKDIPKEVVEVVNNISPETKAAVLLCIIIAFVYGFMRRRRQHLRDENQ